MANRFDYQKDWALYKVLEFQLENGNYVIVLDFHDDILILDLDISPDKIGFNCFVDIFRIIKYDKKGFLGKAIEIL